MCLPQKEKNHAQYSSRGRGGKRGRGRGRKNFRGRGANISKEKCLIFIAYDAIEMDMMLPHVSCLGTKLSRKEMKKSVKHLVKGKENNPSPLIMLWHITTLE